MSYHFRPVLAHFRFRGTTASYFQGPCRTVSDDGTDWLGRLTQARQTMGTIIGRTRKDGSKAFTAQIVIKKGGAIVHREAQTFDRRPASISALLQSMTRRLG
jgi:hypothetical protein